MPPKWSIAKCPLCKLEFKYDPRWLCKTSSLGMLRCDCSHYFVPEKEEKKRGSDNQRRSQAQEKRIAGKIGGRKQPASGSKRNAKGDFLEKGQVRGECKFTRARSFSLKLDELLKLRGEARGDEKAVFHIEFQGVYPVQRFVVLSEDDYLALKGST